MVDRGENGSRQPRRRGSAGRPAPHIDRGKQDKHIAGSNNYIPGRSILTDPDPQALLDLAAGTGDPVNDVPVGRPGSKQRVEFGKVIGHYIDPVTGIACPTTKGVIVDDRKGGAISSRRDHERICIMTALASSDVATSLNRALWGEASPNLRSVQFTPERQHIILRFFFDGVPKDADCETVNCIGAEVAADLPGCKLSEEIVPTTAATAIPRQDGWHVVFARKETRLVA
jgi:hypothetical protein